ncbi:hypothetical protein EVJ50_00455 [Synechococcus sp. RSCCF101]|nr:hypothetical protein EVJ50_00455 [Synechococcus sp. RSCCF101]
MLEATARRVSGGSASGPGFRALVWDLSRSGSCLICHRWSPASDGSAFELTMVTGADVLCDALPATFRFQQPMDLSLLGFCG